MFQQLRAMHDFALATILEAIAINTVIPIEYMPNYADSEGGLLIQHIFLVGFKEFMVLVAILQLQVLY